MTAPTFVPDELVTAAKMNDLPKGVLGYAQIVAAANFTTITDIPGLSVTVTLAANRRLRIVAYCYRISNNATANQAGVLTIREGSTALQSAHVFEGPATGGGGGQHGRIEVILTPTAGTHTYKLSAARDGGADTHILNASAATPAFIMVEDLGSV